MTTPKNTTISVTIPSELLERFNRTRSFTAWNQSCPISEIANLEEVLLTELDSFCEVIENDIIVDDKGNFAGDRLEIYKAKLQ